MCPYMSMWVQMCLGMHSPAWHHWPCQGQAGLSCLCCGGLPEPTLLHVPSPCPSTDTGSCAVPGAQDGGPPPAGMGGPCLESRRLLPVTSSPVSTATLKAHRCCLTNRPAVAFLGDTQPVLHPGLVPWPQTTAPRPPSQQPPVHLLQVVPGLSHSPLPALRPPKGCTPRETGPPKPRLCPPRRHEEPVVTYKCQADRLINFPLPPAVIRWIQMSPETVNWANYSSFRF